jgi:hypothetical protein
LAASFEKRLLAAGFGMIGVVMRRPSDFVKQYQVLLGVTAGILDDDPVIKLVSIDAIQIGPSDFVCQRGTRYRVTSPAFSCVG